MSSVRALARDLGFDCSSSLRRLEGLVIRGMGQAYQNACKRKIGRGAHATEESEAMIKARRAYCQDVVVAYEKHGFQPPERVAWRLEQDNLTWGRYIERHS